MYNLSTEKFFLFSMGYRLEYKSFIDRCIHCKCAFLCQKCVRIFTRLNFFCWKLNSKKRLQIYFNVPKVVYVIIVCKLFIWDFSMHIDGWLNMFSSCWFSTMIGKSAGYIVSRSTNKYFHIFFPTTKNASRIKEIESSTLCRAKVCLSRLS